ncbi:GNAT family N-acetyltransferase [Lacinutrix undariae]
MPETNIKIREANNNDLDNLKLFEQEVIAYERPFAPYLKKDPITYYNLTKLIQDEDAHLLVAHINEQIVASGYARIYNAKPHKKHEKYAYLGFMYVSPEHRGKGINGKIIEALIDKVKKRNVTEIQLDVYAENTSAIKAYNKKGFKPDLLKMRLNTED